MTFPGLTPQVPMAFEQALSAETRPSATVRTNGL